MTSKLKCPFCGEELRNCCAGVIYTCSKPDSCPHEQCYGSKKLWQVLIQTKQALEQYEHKDNLQQQINANNNQIQESYKQIVQIDEQIIENLEKDLEIAVNALKRIKEPTAWGALYQEQELATEALEQIDHIAGVSKMVEHKE